MGRRTPVPLGMPRTGKRCWRTAGGGTNDGRSVPAESMGGKDRPLGPRIAQRGCCRAHPDLMSESCSEPDVELVRDGRNSRKESKKGRREEEVRNSQEKRP